MEGDKVRGMGWVLAFWAVAAIILFILLANLSCVPLQITNVKMVDDCGCTCLSWETNQEAICKVTYCEGAMCFTSELEPEYSTLHSIGIPGGAKNVTITAIGKYSSCSIEIK